MPAIPVMRSEEVIAEKLARYRRASLARDLYDLAWFAQQGPMDGPLIRRLLVLKVWFDVIDDGLGTRPFDADDILRERHESDFAEEAIGYLTTPVDIPGWIEVIRTRFAFLAEMDDDDLGFARCSPGDRWLVERAVKGVQSPPN